MHLYRRYQRTFHTSNSGNSVLAKHASTASPIKGTVMIRFRSESSQNVDIRHIIVDGSSPWVIGRNVTRKCDIIHLNDNIIKFPSVNGVCDTMKMIDYNRHSYIPMSSVWTPQHFSPSTHKFAGFTGNLTINDKNANRPWSDVKRIVDRVHDHTCGHATFSDIKTVLQRNVLWSPVVSQYLISIVEKCESCLACSVSLWTCLHYQPEPCFQ